MKETCQFWDNYGAAANKCEPLLELLTSRLQGFKNGDETKYHVLPIDVGLLPFVLSICNFILAFSISVFS